MPPRRRGPPRASAGDERAMGVGVRWNLRMVAAQRGVWKASDLRRALAEAGLVVSAGKMSHLWSGRPISVRLDDLDVICAVLDCAPTDLLIREPDKVAARRPRRVEAAPGSGSGAGPVVPRLGRHRSLPPA